MASGPVRGWIRRCVAVAVLAVGLAYSEAALVVYLRELIAPIRREHFPAAAGRMLPLLTVRQLEEAGAGYTRLLVVEVSREVAPIVTLLAAAWGLSRGRGQLAAFFLIGFGVWDIFYYVFLRVLIGWPASLGAWDVLYLIPTAWVAPVWAPLVVAATMVAVGLAILRCGDAVPRWRVGPALAVLAGTGLIMASFLLRTAEAFVAVPRRFDWAWFLAGWLLAMAGAAAHLRPAWRRG